MIRLVCLEQLSAVISLCGSSGHGYSLLLVLSPGNATAPLAAVAGAAGRGGAGRCGGGVPGAAARCQHSAAGGGSGVQQGQQELRAPGRGPRRAGGRAGTGESDCLQLYVVISTVNMTFV